VRHPTAEQEPMLPMLRRDTRVTLAPDEAPQVLEDLVKRRLLWRPAPAGEASEGSSELGGDGAALVGGPR
jgi:hypothetical protein